MFELLKRKRELRKLLKSNGLKILNIPYVDDEVIEVEVTGNLTPGLVYTLEQMYTKIEILPKEDWTLVVLYIKNNIKTLPRPCIPLQEGELLLGYTEKRYIIANIKKYPHMLVTGLSNSGKTYLVNNILKSVKGNILVLNGYEEDYKGYKCINNRVEILAVLKDMTENVQPFSILVIDELIDMSTDKAFNTAIYTLLSKARHNNVYVIGIAVEALKQTLSYKSMFNIRIAFRQLDDSNYRTCLGCTPQEELEDYEFFMVTNRLYKLKGFYD